MTGPPLHIETARPACASLAIDRASGVSSRDTVAAVNTQHSTPAPALALDALDEILTWQLLVAWAGERAAEDSPRLGWWKTDLTDPDGGGDFLARLLPITHRWAGLRGAREAARRTELRMIRLLGGAGRVQTLFWLDRTTDEAIEERIDMLAVQSKLAPEDALRWPFSLNGWDRAAFEQAIASAGASTATAVAGGREVRVVPSASLVERARALVGALVPLTEHYPMPFAR